LIQRYRVRITLPDFTTRPFFCTKEFKYSTVISAASSSGSCSRVLGAKQFAGLTQCQSTNQAKIENHVNLALSAVSMAKAAHWLPLDKEQRGPFSMTELKNYYYNLAPQTLKSSSTDNPPVTFLSLALSCPACRLARQSLR
jgi:hypothetical protein